MFDKLHAYLVKWVSAERVDLIMSALECLQAHGLVAAWVEISAILESGTDQDLQSILTDIERIIDVGMDKVLAAHAIQMNGQLAMKTSVLEGLLVLGNYEDGATIAAMCSADDDPIQTLSDLLELVTEKSWSEYAEVLTSVSPTLIAKLASMYDKADGNEDDSEYAAVDVSRMDTIKRYFDKYPNSLAKLAVTDEGCRIGTPLKLILNVYSSKLGEFEPKAPQQAAIELVGQCLISDLPMNDFVKQSKDQIEVIYSDINFITQVDIAMGEVFREVIANG